VEQPVTALSSTADFALRTLGRARRPRVNGRLRVQELAAPVEIFRDTWGVPHIYAENMHDLLFGQGFVHAQDRLWQMEFQRRLISGRLAEVLGSPVLGVDRYMRILGLRRVAEQEAALLSGEPRSEIQAYAAGVNAGITRQPLPVEFALLRYRPEPWTIADSLSWAKMMAWSLSINWETELLRARLAEALGPVLAAELEPRWLAHWPVVAPSAAATVVDSRGVSPAVAPDLGRPGPVMPDAGTADRAAGDSSPAGSNNWVVAGRRTQSGMPLLANDMHLLMSVPAIWYENHLVCRAEAREPGNATQEQAAFNVTGVTFSGIPYVVAGHNGHVAWGFTNGFADVQDLCIERMRVAPGGGVEYEYCGAWREAEVRREVIRVKGSEPVEQTVICTHHGPVINELAPGLATPPRSVGTGVALPDVPLTLRWTALEPNTMMDALAGMNRAQTCLAFREALRAWETPVQNVVYADTQGNIGYSYPGHIPVRRRGDGTVPVPGWTAEYEWQGYIPFDELPHVYNPPQGFVVSANNRVTDDGYPHFLGREFAAGDRAQRIIELIAAQPKLDADVIRRMHFDILSPSMQLIALYLGRLTLPAGEPELTAMLDMVRAWDGQLTADSPAAAICEVFARQWMRVLLEPKLAAVGSEAGPVLLERVLGKGPTPFIQEGSFFGQQTWLWMLNLLGAAESHWFDLGGGETREDVLRLALQRTATYLTEKLGPPEGTAMRNWAWGRLHTLSFGHTLGVVSTLGRHLNRGPYRLPGDGTTVWATGSGMTPESSRGVVAPPFRFIADLSDLRNCLGLLAPGNSGRPDSPHYDDQIAAWYAGEYHPMLYAREDVVAGARSHLRLAPAG
jgi:penicillin G amidase